MKTYAYIYNCRQWHGFMGRYRTAPHRTACIFILRARSCIFILTARSGDERTNHEDTAEGC